MSFKQRSWQKLGSVVGIVGTLAMVAAVPPAIAQSCVAGTSCAAPPLRVTPGQWITFEVVNRTSSIISIEQPSSVEAIALSPGQRITLGGATKNNASLVFWEVQGLSVEARVSQLAGDTLQVELLWGGHFGNSSVYLRDDGLVEVI